MSDQTVAAHIERLVAGAHELQRHGERDRSDATRLPVDRDRPAVTSKAGAVAGPLAPTPPGPNGGLR